MKHKVSRLEGAVLDAAVAKAAGVKVIMWGDRPCIEGGGGMPGSNVTTWQPSSSWEQGGPIIERERITVYALAGAWDAWKGGADTDTNGPECSGPTPLIAAMRAYCASKFGEEVELP